MKLIIVTFFGEAGSGKSTAREALVSATPDMADFDAEVYEFSFGAKVKEIATKHFGWNGVKDRAGRRLLQAIAEAGRQYNPKIWINYVEKEIRELWELHKERANGLWQQPAHMLCVIDDGRFMNEFQWTQFDSACLAGLSKTSGIPVRILRPDNPNKLDPDLASDVSETSIPDVGLFSYVQDNVAGEALFKERIVAGVRGLLPLEKKEQQ